MEKYLDINEGGFSIRCKLYYTDLKKIRRVVVCGHGFGGHKDNRAAQKFADRLITKYKGFAVLCFDWPAHGSDARNRLILKDCLDYLNLVLSYIRKTWKTEELYAYGTSFGGYVFLRYLAEKGNPFRKAALRSPAIRMGDVLRKSILQKSEMDHLMKGKEVMAGFDRKVRISRAFLEEVDAVNLLEEDFLEYADDLLMLHGSADEIVPFEDSLRFSEQNIVELIPIEGADHRLIDPKQMDFAIQKIIEFFNPKTC